MSPRKAASKKIIPREWTFRGKAIAEAFDAHVREQLPWYDLATGIVAHVARHYVPEGGKVIDVGCSTGNVGRALAGMVEKRGVDFVPFDASEHMIKAYHGPGQPRACDARSFDYAGADLIICFLSMMFIPVKERGALLERMCRSIENGGAVIVFDKMVPRPGWLGTVSYRLTLAAKYESGANAEDVIAKELSLSGLQRPMSELQLKPFGFVEFFRFGDFAGWVHETAI